MLNAIVLPRLMSEMAAAMMKITMMALTGTSKPGRTLEIQLENGRALSRAKAKSWRDEPAMTVTQLKKLRMMMMEVMALAAAIDCVEL